MRVLLLLLIAGSAALFWWRFRFVLQRILSSKPDTDAKPSALGARAWTFLSEVLLQSKVIRERPLPGIAHAFVFWSFCAFALVTLNHFSAGLGWPFLHHRSGLGVLYFWFAFPFAVLCAVSIAYLAFRRFVLRPRWLQPLSYESGLIAALIFILMVTFLPEPWLTPGSATESALWWTHTLAILIFLPLIPHTKHLHLVLSPLTIFLKHREFSYIPPLQGDEDFGLIAGQDVTRLTALQAYSCVECGRCTEHCPANNTGKELNPKLIALGVRDYLNEYGPGSDKPMLEATISQTAIFQCTTCGACEYQCPVGIQHLPIILGLRRGAVNTGTWDDEYGAKLFQNLERSGNALGFSQSERDKWIARQQFPIFDGTQEYCLWLGCMGAYDTQGREIIAAFAEIMRYLGTSFGVLKKERCTGDPVRRLGNDLVLSQLAESNLQALTQVQVTRIVAICPHCVRTIAEDWREFGATVQIEHHSEFMARHSARLPQPAASGTVTFHDPCYLGRYRQRYDEPRAVASLGGELVEPDRTRERSFCCGAGGGLVFLGEETGDRVNRERARQLIATGSDTVATACPFCHSMFREALPAEAAAGPSQTPPQLLDIAQIAAARLPPQSRQNGTTL